MATQQTPDQTPEQTPDQTPVLNNLSEGEYFVERIVDKRINPITKQVEYLLKWRDYPSSENSWEPASHLNCPYLINEFELSLMVERQRRLIGFKCWLKPEEVLSACKTKTKELLLFMKWAGVQPGELVPAYEAHE